MESQNQQELIDRFLQKDLNQQELNDFMEKLNSDISFAEEVDLQRIVTKGIELEGVNNLRQRLSAIHQKVKAEQQENKTATKVIPIKQWAAVAAAVIILLFAGYNFWNSASAKEDVYAKYYELYQPDFSTRNQETDQANAEKAYREGDFENVIELLQKVKNESGGNARILLGLGNAFLKTSNYQAATESFEEIIKSENELYIDQARWYLALTFLKQGDVDSCRKILQELAQREGADFSQEAKGLLHQLPTK